MWYGKTSITTLETKKKLESINYDNKLTSSVVKPTPFFKAVTEQIIAITRIVLFDSICGINLVSTATL